MISSPLGSWIGRAPDDLVVGPPDGCRSLVAPDDLSVRRSRSRRLPQISDCGATMPAGSAGRPGSVAEPQQRGFDQSRDRSSSRQEPQAVAVVNAVARACRRPRTKRRSARQAAPSSPVDRRSTALSSPLAAILRDAQMFRLPAPAPISRRPACRSRRLQRQLDLRRRHARRPLQQQRAAAADHRRRHAGAAQLHVGVVAAARACAAADTCAGRIRAGRFERHDPCCPARPRPASRHGRTASGRASCSRDRVVGSRDRAHVSSAPTVIAYGELPGEVMPPRIGTPVGVLAGVARRATTTIPAATARATAWHQRVGRGRLHHRMAERQVDDRGCCSGCGWRSPSRCRR